MMRFSHSIIGKQIAGHPAAKCFIAFDELMPRLKRFLKVLISVLFYYSGMSYVLAIFYEIVSKRIKVIIIMYHSVGDQTLKYTDNIPLDNFKIQIKYLTDNYEIVPLKTALNYLNNNKKNKKPLVVLTFDDGYISVYEKVFPYLKSKGIPAITFVPVRYIGKESDWPRPEKGVKGKIMGWEMLKELKFDQTIEIGSHGVDHRQYSSLKANEIDRDLICSKSLLEENLGGKADYFAYPYGQAADCTKEICNQVKKVGYLAACSTIWGRYSSVKDIYALRRIRIDYQDAFFEFKLKMKGAYDWIEGIHLLKGVFFKWIK
jgi:peptidoglycan/xylan/chitin deacetylase (PgdA/CDA1 family)